jgi:hypothetical protein
VAVAAIVHERRLKRRFDPGYLGEIDVAAKLSLVAGFEIKVFDLAVVDDGHPGLLRVGRVDQHEFAHVVEPLWLGGGRRA